MKSILAKQSPHKSPWAWMRRLQEMQTGGSRRSATAPRAPRHAGVRTGCVSLISMAPMIPRPGEAREAS